MFRSRFSLFAVGSLLLALSFGLISQTTGRRPRALITERVDENNLHRLAGNLRPEAIAENDLGAVADDFPMDHMLLQLKRPPEQEQAAAQFVSDLQNPQSPNFHHWITAEEFGKQFGVAESDVATIQNWLESHGFTVNSVYPSGMVIDFSGTAGQIRRAFHTEIHNLNVNGEEHVANVSDPQIPEALAAAVTGVVSLHDFKPHAMNVHANYTYTSGGQTYQAVVPADLAAIYDLNPLFKAGITGKGQTIVVLEDSNLYTAADWTAFRNKFGLNAYTSGSLTTAHPALATGRTNCSDPGVNSDDGEAILDAEWASAAAPDAAIVVAACGDTRSTFGGFIAMQNILNAANPPSIISVSYGSCEAENGASANAAISSLYQQAVAEGVSVLVAAGDEGAASCDAGATAASHGIGVSAYASTPYNVAVGGTDFSDTIDGTTSTYWSSTNSSTFGSAISYIPEIPWNDSCAGSLLAKYFGYTQVYGTNGFCNSSTATKDQLQAVAGGSGGPSGCFTGSPTTTGVVSGTCKGVAKPSWQAGLAGIPSDGVRDIPDVSLFASNGLWGHYYVVCYSDIRNGGASCAGAPSAWSGAGGTSFSSPIMAGIIALVNQKTGHSQGNPAPVLYKLAANTPSAFHSITRGDIDVNCTGTVNCYGSSTTTTTGGGGGRGRGGRTVTTYIDGALSTSSSSLKPAYAAAAGWNFATGIGSVDAFNLVMNWTNGY